MNPKEMKSNEDLHEYICWLVQELKTRGQNELADQLAVASDFSFGSPSEFLYEAESVLKKVRDVAGTILSDSEKEDVDAAIRQIDLAFKRIGEETKSGCAVYAENSYPW
ncbi:MAG: hypothetical protein K8S55_07060 [Phycisphaerae bacterium]|nr:hypothetical protein [Phycisphaerae bacterium]